MNAGRNAYAARNGSRKIAFSTFPFTRAHITRPFSELSARAPETYIKVIPGFSRARVSAAATAIPYVTRSYAASDNPAEDTPRQKKHASKPVRFGSISAY